MKIVYVSDVIYPFIKGGCEKRIYELSRRLTERGHEVHVYGINWWNGHETIEMDGVYIHGVCDPMSLYANGTRSIKEALVFSRKILPYLLKEDFDIVDCNQFPFFPCFVAKIASIKRKSPLVITWCEVWKDYWYDYLGSKGFLGKWIEHFTAKLTDNVIAVSEKTKKGLLSLGVKNVHVIPNGIDLEKIQRITPSKEEFDVLFVGRLIKEKNVDVLIKAIELVRKKLPEMKCGIIGNGPEKKRLVRLTEKLNLGNIVQFLGFLESDDDVISYMKSSKMLVHPSTREGFGIVPLEANACGLPVIGVKHKNSAVDELIEDGYNGFLLEKLCPKAICDKVLMLMDEGVRGEYSKRAITHSRHYDWEKITDSIEAFYSSL